MQNMILLLFALFFSLGLYLILAAVFKVPTYKATKAVLGASRRIRNRQRTLTPSLRSWRQSWQKSFPWTITSAAS